MNTLKIRSDKKRKDAERRLTNLIIGMIAVIVLLATFVAYRVVLAGPPSCPDGHSCHIAIQVQTQKIGCFPDEANLGKGWTWTTEVCSNPTAVPTDTSTIVVLPSSTNTLTVVALPSSTNTPFKAVVPTATYTLPSIGPTITSTLPSTTSTSTSTPPSVPIDPTSTPPGHTYSTSTQPLHIDPPAATSTPLIRTVTPAISCTPTCDLCNLLGTIAAAQSTQAAAQSTLAAKP